jgi:hypothetical protein
MVTGETEFCPWLADCLASISWLCGVYYLVGLKSLSPGPQPVQYPQPPPSHRINCWVASESAKASRQNCFPQFSPSKIELRALFSLPTFWCSWGKPLVLSTCCPLWVLWYKREPVWPTRQQKSLQPAVTPGTQRREASTVREDLKWTTNPRIAPLSAIYSTNLYTGNYRDSS